MSRESDYGAGGGAPQEHNQEPFTGGDASGPIDHEVTPLPAPQGSDIPHNIDSTSPVESFSARPDIPPHTDDTPTVEIFPISSVPNSGTVREQAVVHVLAHPKAEIPPRLSRQFDAGESHVLASRRLEEPTTADQRAALEAIQQGADLQIAGQRSTTRGEKMRRGAAIGAVAAAIVIPTTSAAIDSGKQVPRLAVERATSEFPAEIGTQQLNVLGVEITVPSIEGTLDKRDENIAAAQARLDEAVDSTTRNASIAGGTLIGGLIAGQIFARRGYNPAATTRRVRGRILENQGWQRLGEPKGKLKARYDGNNKKP